METDKGIVVILGCCHSGLVNTLEYIEQALDKRDIYAIIGGTHLGFCSQNQQERTLLWLAEKNISRIAVSHCTGFAASARIHKQMPKAFQVAMVGYCLEV